MPTFSATRLDLSRVSCKTVSVSIAENVREARQARELTREQLAGLAQCSLATIIRLESGVTEFIQLRRLEKVAEALGTSLAALLDTQTEG